MDGNKFRAALLAIIAAVTVPIINSVYGKLPAAVSTVIVAAAFIFLIVLIIKKPSKKAALPHTELCSDIKKLSIAANGKNYVISAGTDFQIDNNLQSGILSYIEGGVWHIQDNGEAGNAPVEIRVPEDFVPELLEITADTGNVMVLIPAVAALKLSVHNGEASIRKIRTGDIFAEAGRGKIDLTAELSGSAQISCGSGSVKAFIENSADEFNIEAVTGIGSIRVQDEVFGKERRKGSIGSGAEKNIRLSCGMGSIEVDFGRRENL